MKSKRELIRIPIKVINTDLEGLPVNTCVYVTQYRFKTCSVTTCKNYTLATKSKCLAVDRVQPLGNKIISDSELHLFKFGEECVTTRLVAIKRKKAVSRVKAILILHSFIEFIKSKNNVINKTVYKGRLVEKAEIGYPLRITKLGFKNWMWPYLVNQKLYEKFTGKKEGECSAFKLHTLVDMTALKFNNLLVQLSPQLRKIK